MTDGDPAFDDWAPPQTLFEDAPIRERMVDVIVGLRTPSTVTDVAERVGCDTETARDYLDWFREIGMVREHTGRPVRYECNRSYLRWRRIERIRETYTDEEIVAELAAARAEIEAYEERFDADHPDDVSLLDVPADGDADVETVWEAISGWQTVRRRAELLDAARRERVTPGATDA